ncbi:MAG: peptide deformylase [Verrucomicrobiaceae bacterium]
MVLKVVRYPTAVLRAKCRSITQVTDRHRQLAADMLETMNDERGVGLAAPQVAVDEQMAVIDVSHNPQCVSYFTINGVDKDMVAHMPIIFINPKLELGRDKVSDEEGCLSFPDLRGQIRRSTDIKVTYETLDGATVTIETDGLLARAFQHEIDHLNGILFIDRMSPVAKAGLKRKLSRLMADWAEDDAAAQVQGD